MKSLRKEILINTIIAIILITVACSVAFTLASVYNASLERLEFAMSEFEDRLPDHVSVETGVVESPSVIIILDTKEDFLNKVIELGADSVYHSEFVHSRSYYVFRNDYQKAWKYNFSFVDEE